MKFEDVQEQMWLRYKGKHWYVKLCNGIYCKMVNHERVLKLTSWDFIIEDVKQVQPPVFQLNDKVIYIVDNIFLKNRIATIHFIDEDSEKPYFVKAPYLVEAERANPFELQTINY